MEKYLLYKISKFHKNILKDGEVTTFSLGDYFFMSHPVYWLNCGVTRVYIGHVTALPVWIESSVYVT